MQWDYIVIGAGSAGCALADQLARSGEDRVLVLESGGKDSSIFIKIPAGQIQAIKRNVWNFVTQPDPSRNGKIETWQRGRVLGGSSSINGMMHVRGAASDFDRWAALGNHGWAYADVLPVFREMESSDQRSMLRGDHGPLSVQTVRNVHPLTDAFVASAVACGWPFNADYNGATQDGVGYAQLSQRNGIRCSAAGAFLKPLIGRGNLKLLLNATVQRVHLLNGRATGVSFACNGELHTATARHIILSTGSINSPKLLMLSGIGDRQELARHDIHTLVHLPSVGKYLREHPLIRLTYETRVPSNNPTQGLGQRLRTVARYVATRTGPIAYLFEAAAFLRSTPHVAEPDIQLHFLSVGYTHDGRGGLRLLNRPSVTVLLNKSHPASCGRIRLASKDPDDAPLIECRLLEDDADLDTLVHGVGTVRKIMATEPISNLIQREIVPAVDGSALWTYIRNNAEIAYHPVGTCRMGVNEDAVVTPDLRVRGVENLWVADASVMPDLISGNTNAACMMIGMKLGQYLRRSYARSAA